MSMEKPNNLTDLKAILSRKLGVDDVNQYFTFREDLDYLAVIPKTDLGSLFGTTLLLLKEMEGEYLEAEKEFRFPYAEYIPKEEPSRSTSIPTEEASTTSIPEHPRSIVTEKEKRVTTRTPTPPIDARSILIDKIDPSPHQPRLTTDETEIKELADSIKEDRIRDPLDVRRKSSGRYEIIDGHRRWKAAKIAGLTEVPCIIHDMSDKEVRHDQLIRHIHRKDLTDYELALQFDGLLKDSQDEYPTDEVLAFRFKKSRSWVAQRLRMLELITIVTRVTMLKLTERQAREILAVQDPQTRAEVAKHFEERMKADVSLSPSQIKAFADKATLDKVNLECERAKKQHASESSEDESCEEPVDTTGKKYRRIYQPPIFCNDCKTTFKPDSRPKCPHCQKKNTFPVKPKRG